MFDNPNTDSTTIAIETSTSTPLQAPEETGAYWHILVYQCISYSQPIY